MSEHRSITADRRFVSETMQQLRIAPQAGVIQFVIGEGRPDGGTDAASAYTATRHYAVEPWMKLTAALMLLEDLAGTLEEALADPELAGVRLQTLHALKAFGLAPGDLKAELSTDSDQVNPDSCQDYSTAHGVRSMEVRRKAAE
ncbi:hypothetical protein [Parvibaculum sp.]|uniref:hypothetical protein n=1 Tax=Parvibaculum sp. TaxID=2024848 RepID=UPI00391DAC88